MAKINAVILKPGKEKALLNHHHWIFSGAIDSFPSFSNGEILTILSHDGVLLGSGYFNRNAKITGRMLSFDQTSGLEALKKNLNAAFTLREKFSSQTTNAYRLVNAEGDLLPGLIVDRYADQIVVQVSTLGMSKLLPEVVSLIKGQLQPSAIFEKSDSSTLKEEGLTPSKKVLYGNFKEEIVILENGLKFAVESAEGQKTGFFLDQREMRQFIRELAHSKKVLNCFSYTGGFSTYAQAGGAVLVDSVDVSEKALKLARKNSMINGFEKKAAQYFAEDVFQFLRQSALNYDIVILDPPAFAKKSKDIIQACRGYKDINRVAMQKMPAGSLLLSCSCSHHVNEELFQKILFQASVEAKRTIQIISKHRQAIDHPINLCHPESAYLKSFLLYVS